MRKFRTMSSVKKTDAPSTNQSRILAISILAQARFGRTNRLTLDACVSGGKSVGEDTGVFSQP